ncbi:MAG: hypothetical protein AB1689_05390 [Thermodesulfobacteriota bacterium]
MAKTTARRAVKRHGARDGLEATLEMLGKRAQKLVDRNRAEVQKAVQRAVQRLRAEVERRTASAERALREAERRILKQMHVATEEEVKRLERRVLRLEQRRPVPAGA